MFALSLGYNRWQRSMTAGKDNKPAGLGIDSALHGHSASSPHLTEYVSLPPWDEKRTVAHYDQANANTADFRITGYHGVAIAEEGGDAFFTLYLINGDKDKVIARLTIKKDDLRKTTAALIDLIENYGKSAE